MVHFCRGFYPFLFGVAHAVGVVEIFSHAQADKAVVRVGIFFVHEVSIVGGDDFHAVFFAQFNNFFVYALLLGKCGLVGIGTGGFMTLDFEVEIVAENIFEPLNGFFGSADVAVVYFSRNFAAQASGRNDKPFVVLLQQLFIDARTVVKSFRPAFRYHFDEVFVTRQVFGKHHQMPAAAVYFFGL